MSGDLESFNLFSAHSHEFIFFTAFTQLCIPFMFSSQAVLLKQQSHSYAFLLFSAVNESCINSSHTVMHWKWQFCHSWL